MSEQPSGGGWVDLDLSDSSEGKRLINADSATPERIDWSFALRWSSKEMAEAMAKMNASGENRSRTPGQHVRKRPQPTHSRSTSGDMSMLAAAARRMLTGRPVEQKPAVDCADESKAMGG